jgi:methanol metabolism-related c-type cytochrome
LLSSSCEHKSGFSPGGRRKTDDLTSVRRATPAPQCALAHRRVSLGKRSKRAQGCATSNGSTLAPPILNTNTRRYKAECLRCHGPDGSGSSYAPALTDSLKTLSYNDFLGIVAAGKKAVNTGQDLVMPALGDDKNVMCYIDDIYVYLRARANQAIGPERPAKHEEKPEAATKSENSCMGP